MKESAADFLALWKDDYRFKTVTSATLSALVNLAFTVFNGVLGLLCHSVWHGSICVYYVLLAIVRGTLVRSVQTEKKVPPGRLADRRQRIFRATHFLLGFMALALIVPIALMIKGERTYTYGLIPAIAMAAYTFYRMTMSILHLRRSRHSDNILIREIRTVNLQDTLVAMLTLQNALIIANGNTMSSMIQLTAWTSAGIWLLIVASTIVSCRNQKPDGSP